MAFTSVDFIFTLILLLRCVVLSPSQRYCNYVTTSGVTHCGDVDKQEYFDEGAFQCRSCMLCEHALFKKELEMSKEDFYSNVLNGGDDCRYKCKEYLYFCVISPGRDEIEQQIHDDAAALVRNDTITCDSVSDQTYYDDGPEKDISCSYCNIPTFLKSNDSVSKRNYENITSVEEFYTRLKQSQDYNTGCSWNCKEFLYYCKLKNEELKVAIATTSEPLQDNNHNNNGLWIVVGVTSVVFIFFGVVICFKWKQIEQYIKKITGNNKDNPGNNEDNPEPERPPQEPQTSLLDVGINQEDLSNNANGNEITTTDMNENSPLTAVNNPSNSEPLAADTLDSLQLYSLNQPLSHTTDEHPTSLFSDSYMTSMRHWSRLDSTLSEELNRIPEVVNKELLSLYGNDKLLVISYEGDNIGEARTKINEATNLNDEDYNVRLVDRDTNV